MNSIDILIILFFMIMLINGVYLCAGKLNAILLLLKEKLGD